MNRHGKYLLLAAGVLLATSCVDDPVTVTDESTEQPPALPVAYQQQGAAGTTNDSFRERLDLDVQVVGDVAPHQSVTLVIEGVANEKLTGGDVQLLLPTFASMDHAGVGKRPSYPVGKALPVEASWALQGMDAGATWKRTVDIDLPDKGYYHVAVRAEVTAPDEKFDPYVFDDAADEAWLVVQDGGGYTTRHFDEKVFGDDLIPQPGPFRLKRSATAGDMIGADMAAASASSASITLEPIYYNRSGHMRSPVGAEVKARYISQNDQHGYVITKTVPSSGHVTFECPEDRYTYIVASVSVPSTVEVKADYRIGGGDEFDEHDCGETGQLLVQGHYYLPWKNLNRVIPKIEDHFEVYRQPVVWTVDLGRESGTYRWLWFTLTLSDDTIIFGRDYWSVRTAAHEFGHALHNYALGGSWDGTCPSPHFVDQPSNYKCAMSEGFADYAGAIGEGQPTRYESVTYNSGNRPAGTVEGNVAKLFTDLIDRNRDGNDRTNYPANYVANVFRTCRVSGFSRINDVSDFVWCLENRVNRGVHNANFPGIGAPSDATEAAYEPDNWNADHIRSTWLQNVGNN